jgi:acyl carrier protein
MERLEEEVAAFLASSCSVPRRKLQATSCLQTDIGVDGDEAAELMLAFAERFQVSLEPFEFQKYFYDEWSLVNPICLVGRLLCRSRKIPVTVGDLVESADARVWLGP